MGRDGRSWIIDSWSWTAVADRYMEGFAAAIAGVDRGRGPTNRP